MTDMVITEVATWRAGIRRALVAAPVVGVVGALVGYLSLRGSDGGATTDPVTTAATFGQILGRNLPVALLLYSGVATAGSSTLVALLLVGGYVGATFATAATAVGARVAAGSIAIYAPLEMAALLLAATAGLVPIASLWARRDGEGRRAAYTGGLLPSLGVLAISLVLLVVAAGAEAIVIRGRTS